MADSAEEWESRLRARMDNLRNRLLDVEGCLKQDLDWILGIIDAAEEAAREAERERCAGMANSLFGDTVVARTDFEEGFAAGWDGACLRIAAAIREGEEK